MRQNVDDIGDNGRSGRQVAGTASVEHDIADRISADKDGVEDIVDAGQRIFVQNDVRRNEHEDIGGRIVLIDTTCASDELDDTAEGFRGVDRNVARLDGVNVREVPADLMKSSYVFTEGWVPATGAKQINMILADPDAVAAPVKYETAMMSAPTAQSKGKYLYYERYYYGAFVLAQRTGGIIVNAAA